MLRLLLVLVVSSVLAMGCTQNNEQRRPAHTEGASISQAAAYACPMHPDVASDKPGTCKVCGMDLRLVTQPAEEPDTLTPEQQILRAKNDLQRATAGLVRDGSYRCCIQEPCLECALAHQSCTCLHDLKAGKPVCPECYGGWQRGEGRVPSIKASDVKVSYSDHKH
jgi:hypothetical protein